MLGWTHTQTPRWDLHILPRGLSSAESLSSRQDWLTHRPLSHEQADAVGVKPHAEPTLRGLGQHRHPGEPGLSSMCSLTARAGPGTAACGGRA